MRYLYWFLGLCGVSPVFSIAFALIARTIPAPVLVLALCSVADVAVFFPNSAVFELVLGTSVLAYGILALPLYSLATLMVWPFLLRLPILHLSPSCGCWPYGF